MIAVEPPKANQAGPYLRRAGFFADFFAFLGDFFFADFLTGFAAFDLAVERPPLKILSQFSEYCFVAPMRTTLMREELLKVNCAFF
jgi:hypothetical protein